MRHLLWLSLLIGCSDSAATLPGPPEWNREVTPPTDEVAASQRAACGYQAGALPAETQGVSHPNGADIPIDHIVVMMMENRSFDHYFQKLPDHGPTDAEVAPAGFMNLDNDGHPVLPSHDSSFCFLDTAHGWNAVHRQVNGGLMDGFFASNDQSHETPMPGGTLDMLSGARALTYYDEGDLPLYYWIADNFSIADHYFCSVQGPTWPNRAYLYGATSRGKISNQFIRDDVHTIFDQMTERALDWTIYYHRSPGFGVFIDRMLYYGLGDGSDGGYRARYIDHFFADAAAGTLPQVSFVDPDLGHEGVGANDEHPPADMKVGQQFVAKVVDAVMKSPNWASTALFITYDEHGGLYDHVVPPKACPPDDVPPETTPTDAQATFDHYGVRVPLLVISPYARKHFVAHHVYDHTSIDRFIEARFVIPAMTGRDANAEAPWELFDFAHPVTERGTAPMPTLDQAKLDQCLAVFGPGGQAP